MNVDLITFPCGLQPMPLDRFVLRGPAKARRLPRTFAMLRARGVIVQELGRQ